MRILITLFLFFVINPVFSQVEWYSTNNFENDIKYLLKNQLIDELLYFRLLDYEFKNKEFLNFGKISVYKMIDILPSTLGYTSSTGQKEKLSYNISKRNNQNALHFTFEVYNLDKELKIAKIDFGIFVYHFNGEYFTSFEKTIINPKERVTYSHKIEIRSKGLKNSTNFNFYIEKIGKKNILKHAKYILKYIQIELEDGTIINYDG